MSVKTADSGDVHVAENIRVLRNVRNISQTALAEKLGVTFQQVQKYETGKNRVGAGRLLKIADALNVPVSRLFEGAPSSARNAQTIDDPLRELGKKTDGIALARAFNAITSPDMRRAFVDMVEAAAMPKQRRAA